MPTNDISQKLSRLKPRERDILQGICDGLRYWEIGKRLGLAEGTIKAYVHIISAKLELQGLHRDVKKQRLLNDYCPHLDSVELALSSPEPDEAEEVLPLTEEEEREVEELEQALTLRQPPPIVLPPASSQAPRRRFTSCALFGIIALILGALAGTGAFYGLEMFGNAQDAPTAISAPGDATIPDLSATAVAEQISGLEATIQALQAEAASAETVSTPAAGVEASTVTLEETSVPSPPPTQPSPSPLVQTQVVIVTATPAPLTPTAESTLSPTSTPTPPPSPSPIASTIQPEDVRHPGEVNLLETDKPLPALWTTDGEFTYWEGFIYVQDEANIEIIIEDCGDDEGNRRLDIVQVFNPIGRRVVNEENCDGDPTFPVETTGNPGYYRIFIQDNDTGSRNGNGGSLTVDGLRDQTVYKLPAPQTPEAGVQSLENLLTTDEWLPASWHTNGPLTYWQGYI